MRLKIRMQRCADCVAKRKKLDKNRKETHALLQYIAKLCARMTHHKYAIAGVRNYARAIKACEPALQILPAKKVHPFSKGSSVLILER